MALPLTDELAAPAATLPAGVSLRPFAGEADLAAFVEIFRAANTVDGFDDRTTLEGMRNWVSHPSASFDASRDVVVAEADGRPVAYGFTTWADTSDGVREYSSRGHVHPDWRRRGVGTAILRHNEAHLRELAAEHEVETPRVYGAYAQERRVGSVKLLEANGYRPVRWFFDMLRPTLDDIEVPPLPEGLEIRPVAGREQLRKVFEADREAFRDHWGGFDTSDELFERFLEDPDYEPALFVVAWDGDEIAGAVWNVILAEQNRELGHRRGLLDSVYVRRPWRGRGLASALVGRSLQLLRERGMTSATLGVDADNPNGALRLYENAGFRVDVRSTGYRKPMEVLT
jgi:mycothiol synthase